VYQTVLHLSFHPFLCFLCMSLIKHEAELLLVPMLICFNIYSYVLRHVRSLTQTFLFCSFGKRQQKIVRRVERHICNKYKLSFLSIHLHVSPLCSSSEVHGEMWSYQKPGFEALLLAELQRQQQCSQFCDTLLKTEGMNTPKPRHLRRITLSP